MNGNRHTNTYGILITDGVFTHIMMGMFVKKHDRGKIKVLVVVFGVVDFFF